MRTGYFQKTLHIKSKPLINRGGWTSANTRFHNMKKSNTTALGTLAVFLSGLMIGACAATQIDTELPANHPANPAAEAAVFAPPPSLLR
jgi:uncharacterized membrane protein